MRKLILVLYIASLFISCKNENDAHWYDNAIETASVQLKTNADKFSGQTVLPRSYKDGNYRVVDAGDWTSGFFPGSLWLMYDLTGDNYFKESAHTMTSLLEENRRFTKTHDIGFMINTSWGNQYRVLNDTLSKNIMVESAYNLAARFNENIGMLHSRNFGKWNYPVIIETMMNLELLFKVSDMTEDRELRRIAIAHSDSTIKNHYRPNGSAYQVVSFNNDGTIEKKGTNHGHNANSSWARGQSWGLYGFTMAYRETGLERYRQQAEKTAEFIMQNAGSGGSVVPYWDYDAPYKPDAFRDVSAAAISASALLELSRLTDNQTYFNYAENLLKELSSPEYLAAPGTNGGFVLMHGVGHMPASSEIDVPLVYADYYYLEALNRYKEITTITSPR